MISLDEDFYTWIICSMQGYHHLPCTAVYLDTKASLPTNTLHWCFSLRTFKSDNNWNGHTNTFGCIDDAIGYCGTVDNATKYIDKNGFNLKIIQRQNIKLII